MGLEKVTETVLDELLIEQDRNGRGIVSHQQLIACLAAPYAEGYSLIGMNIEVIGNFRAFV